MPKTVFRDKPSPKATSDIQEALYGLTHFFAMHQLTPAVVELSSPEDGMRLRSMLGSELLYMPQFVDPKADVWNQVELMGVIIRWPARAYAIPGGGYEWH
jgi:hypothetical protein